MKFALSVILIFVFMIGFVNIFCWILVHANRLLRIIMYVVYTLMILMTMAVLYSFNPIFGLVFGCGLLYGEYYLIRRRQIYLDYYWSHHQHK